MEIRLNPEGVKKLTSVQPQWFPDTYDHPRRPSRLPSDCKVIPVAAYVLNSRKSLVLPSCGE